MPTIHSSKRYSIVKAADTPTMNITDGTQLSPAQLELLSINTIRFLSVDAVQKADSGHPGLPLGAAPMAYVLWTRFLQHNPANPHWFDRDRFVLSAGGNPPDIILMATGSEVSLILAVGQRLIQRQIKVRIVSLPSWELFETQPRSYRDGVLPPSVNTRLAVEAGTTQGWRMYVGEQGDVVGVDHFGASAPGHEIMCQNGFTVDDVFARALKLLNLEGVDSRLSQLI